MSGPAHRGVAGSATKRTCGREPAVSLVGGDGEPPIAERVRSACDAAACHEGVHGHPGGMAPDVAHQGAEVYNRANHHLRGLASGEGRDSRHAGSVGPASYGLEAVPALGLDAQLNLIPEDARRLSSAALGVFGPNKSAPLHRWVNFTEGFSAQLVAQALTAAPRRAVVYDPFGGTGTTPLVAAQLGHIGRWAEVNPYLREAAEVKVAAAESRPSFRRRIVRQLQEALLAGPLHDEAAADHPLRSANKHRDFFPPEAAEELVGWIARFDQLETKLARRVGRLGAASCAIAVSNMKRAVDLRRRTPAELRRERPRVGDAVRERIAEFAADLATFPVAPGTARCVSHDARTLPEDIEPVDLVVTSPPYLNGTNYCRNTKLELLLLGLIESERDLGALRTRAVTAGINNVSQRIAEPEILDCVEPIASRLDEVSYDPRIPKMVRAYFADMKKVLSITRNKMTSEGRLVLDIGDSRFAGVHVDTPELLVQLAESVGWTLESNTTLRARTAKDGTALCQKLLYLSSS